MINLQCQATQDHELAGIRDTWQATDTVSQGEFASWLEDDDTKHIKLVFDTFHPDWVTFVQKCAACGMRQMRLDAEPEEESR